MKKKLTEIVEQYGRWVIIIYLSTFVVTFGGVFLLIQFGFKEAIMDLFPKDWVGEDYASAGSAIVAYAITKATQPIRIAITIALVPLFGRRVNS